jgi:hypothetical protein
MNIISLKNTILSPKTDHPSVLQQILISGIILLLGFGVHLTLQWQQYNTLPTPAISQGQNRLSTEDLTLARTAWQYFENNRLPTGLVSSAADFPATTMWDVGSQLAGMVAARELNLLDSQPFDQWMQQTLGSLAKIPLYHNELPNKAYNAKTLIPVNYGQLDKPQEIGFSSLDLARLVQWLTIISHRYPQHAAASQAVIQRWNLSRLVKEGELMGTEARKGEETWNQEGRVGYEQYAAYGLKNIGILAPKAADPTLQVEFVNVMGVEVPTDKRKTYHNYVTSEPYILDGLETGFQALPPDYAGRILQAQQKRYQQTHQLTAWSEDNLDKEPWFVYNCIFVNGEPWKTLDSSGKDATVFRGSSVKAAIGWHMLFQNTYTEKVYKGMRWLADPKRGVFAGFYEETQQPNRALTVNTNGIVLEALLYRRVGKPLMVWAQESIKS